MATTTHLLTAEDLIKLPSDRRCELVRGEVRDMSPSGFDHGAVIVSLTVVLGNHVAQRKLGVVLGAETGFILSRNPDTVRAPDIAFVKQSRISAVGRPQSYWSGAPDVAVEVVSPGDTVHEIEEKVDEYLAAGAAMVWVVSPKRRTVTVYRPSGNPVVLRETDMLDGQDVIPAFSCPVAHIFM